MNEPQPIPKRRRWRKSAILALLVLVVYPLSIGPAAWLTRKAGGSAWVQKAGDILYGPLGLATSLTGTDDWVMNYVDWWLK